MKYLLNTKDWENFKLKNLFDIKKGERINISNRLKNNDYIPLITSSSENNGVADFISYSQFKDKKKIFKNKITIDMFFNVFYQGNNYFSDDNVHTLILKNSKKENQYVYIFIASVLNFLKYKYAYGRQTRLNKLNKEVIKLPSKNREPDWQFMEEYIKDRFALLQNELPVKVSILPKKKICFKNWEFFNLINDKKQKGLFTFKVGIDKSKIDSKVCDSVSNDKVYIISNQSHNNGVERIILGVKGGQKNSITLATRGNDYLAFYHPYAIIPIVRVINLIPYSFKINIYIAMFLCRLIRLNAYKCNYGRVLSGRNILNEKILLPVKSKQPDWQFMEDYIKSLPYSFNL